MIASVFVFTFFGSVKRHVDCE